jgi:type IV pilus assembly protein PilX
MKNTRLPGLGRVRQRGFILPIVLIFLVILTMLGISSMQNATLQERMSSNLRDRNIALQAAELALRDAERDLGALLADGTTFCPGGGTAGGVNCRPALARAPTAGERVGFWIWGPAMRQTWTPGCANGQCLPIDNTGAAAPVWDDTQANWSPQSGSTGANPTVAYGTYTGAAAIARCGAAPVPGCVTELPRYIMEIFPANTTDYYGTGGSQSVVFRVTVRAVGQNPNTVVVLQSVTMPN